MQSTPIVALASPRIRKRVRREPQRTGSVGLASHAGWCLAGTPWSCRRTARPDCALRTARGRGPRSPSSRRRFRPAASRLPRSRLLGRASGPGPSAAHSHPRPHGPWCSIGTGFVPVAGIRREQAIRPRGGALKPPPSAWMAQIGETNSHMPEPEIANNSAQLASGYPLTAGLPGPPHGINKRSLKLSQTTCAVIREIRSATLTSPGPAQNHLASSRTETRLSFGTRAKIRSFHFCTIGESRVLTIFFKCRLTESIVKLRMSGSSRDTLSCATRSGSRSCCVCSHRRSE